MDGRPPTEQVSFPPMTALPETEAVIEAVPFAQSFDADVAPLTL